MSAGEPLRPRRGWQPDEGPEDPTASDDTPESSPSPARRGAPLDDQAEAAEAPQQPERPYNPFARPGSEAAMADVPPAPALPLSDTPIPAPVFPRSSGEFADSPSPAPRRSALSSTTPVEAEPAEAAAPHWFQEHRRTLITWAAAGLAAALVVAVVVSLVVSSLRPTSPTSGSPSPSASPSVSVAPDAATPADLVTAEDLSGIAGGGWAITETTHAAADHKGRVACFQTKSDDANPTFSLQRTLGTTADEPVAALHRIDAFSSAAVAKATYEARLKVLANCAEVPSFLQSANKVEGLAPEAFQITVLFQDDKPRYHTVLLTLSGTVVQVLDVTQVDKAVDAASLATALERSQTQLSEKQGEPAPKDVKVSGADLPAADPAGWLVPSDLPRIRAGVGRWNMKAPGALTSQGMGCENMTLVSVSGPKSREQSTYLMTQDDQAPETFGIDEMRFTFDKNKDAESFAKKLGDALASCKDRAPGSNVQKLKDVKTKTADGEVTSRLFVITRATSASKSVTYQLIVTQIAERATYSLITVTDDYRFSDGQLAALASRAALRTAQA
ncbi:MAG: hypothetical protein QM713_04485 [Arachnia sp.]